MTDFKKVNDDLSIAGQISAEELRKLAIEGFKSVLNLRDPDENGFFHDEKQEAQIVGLEYTNIPLNSQAPNQELTAEAILEIDHLPKPILIHCAGGARAGGVALIAEAIQSGFTYEEIAQKANELSINLEQPHLKQFLVENFAVKQI
ncbi:sulfur transferase domain-containing protein [Dolichospermum lemmermannii CS-548]|uniref:beta-lactamase hydrolase domain-containing protein n=1 Tax=Dolichospermum lemmermannii TaxID=54295 RepID=UPI00233011A2|nr:sulfur transferase domain-containing protein [Dolichospermum lemmermannii]MDB9436072.1 sulfur transferase domain-containing protein [Dolichospermum lemmermannii CS-548]